jgi:hypothetical protein
MMTVGRVTQRRAVRKTRYLLVNPLQAGYALTAHSRIRVYLSTRRGQTNVGRERGFEKAADFRRYDESELAFWTGPSLRGR